MFYFLSESLIFFSVILILFCSVVTAFFYLGLLIFPSIFMAPGERVPSYFNAPRNRATCFRGTVYYSMTQDRTTRGAGSSYPSTFITPGGKVSSYFYAPRNWATCYTAMLVQNTGQLEVPGSSADEFVFFPLAFSGGTLNTRLMAALLLAHG
jgi:hypothetical protein